MTRYITSFLSLVVVALFAYGHAGVVPDEPVLGPLWKRGTTTGDKGLLWKRVTTNGDEGPMWKRGTTTGDKGPMWKRGTTNGDKGPMWKRGTTTGDKGPMWKRGTTTGDKGYLWKRGTTTGDKGPMWKRGTTTGDKGYLWKRGTTTGDKGPMWKRGTTTGDKGYLWKRGTTTGDKGPMWKRGTTTGDKGPMWKRGTTTGDKGPMWKRGTTTGDKGYLWKRGTTNGDEGPMWKRGTTTGDKGPMWKRGTTNGDKGLLWKRGTTTGDEGPMWKRGTTTGDKGLLWKRGRTNGDKGLLWKRASDAVEKFTPTPTTTTVTATPGTGGKVSLTVDFTGNFPATAKVFSIWYSYHTDWVYGTDLPIGTTETSAEVDPRDMPLVVEFQTYLGGETRWYTLEFENVTTSQGTVTQTITSPHFEMSPPSLTYTPGQDSHVTFTIGEEDSLVLETIHVEKESEHWSPVTLDSIYPEESNERFTLTSNYATTYEMKASTAEYTMSGLIAATVYSVPKETELVSLSMAGYGFEMKPTTQTGPYPDGMMTFVNPTDTTCSKTTTCPINCLAAGSDLETMTMTVTTPGITTTEYTGTAQEQTSHMLLTEAYLTPTIATDFEYKCVLTNKQGKTETQTTKVTMLDG